MEADGLVLECDGRTVDLPMEDGQVLDSLDLEAACLWLKEG